MKTISAQLLERFLDHHAIDGLAAEMPSTGFSRIQLSQRGVFLPAADQRRLLKKMVGFPYPHVRAAIDHTLRGGGSFSLSRSSDAWVNGGYFAQTTDASIPFQRLVKKAKISD